MVKRQTSTSSNFYRKRRSMGTKSLSSPQRKEVAKIAKDITIKQAEVKTALNYWAGQSVPDGLCRSFNLCYFMSQGSQASNFIGEKIRIKNIVIKGFTRSQISTSGNYQPKYLRLMIIKTKKQLTSGSATDIALTDVYRNSEANPNIDHIDPSKVDLLYDKTLRLVPVLNATEVSQHYTIDLPVNRVENYDADTSGFFKKQSYYFLMHCFDGNGLYAPLNNWFQYEVNFTDL